MDREQPHEWSNDRKNEVCKFFQRVHSRIHRKDVGAYVQKVVEALKRVLTQDQIAKRLGAKGATAVQQWMKGKMRPERIELFRELIGKRAEKVEWIPSSDRSARALIETIRHFRAFDLGEPDEGFGREEFEALELTLGNDKWLAAQRDQDHQGLVREAEAILRGLAELRETEPVFTTTRVRTLPDLLRLCQRWGGWYTRCKDAILRVSSREE